jgi:hypothetical protein
MTNAKSALPCETCGEPATVAVRDITVIPDSQSVVARVRPHGDPHYFCRSHQMDNMQIGMAASPLFDSRGTPA